MTTFRDSLAAGPLIAITPPSSLVSNRSGFAIGLTAEDFVTFCRATCSPQPQRDDITLTHADLSPSEVVRMLGQSGCGAEMAVTGGRHYEAGFASSDAVGTRTMPPSGEEDLLMVSNFALAFPALSGKCIPPSLSPGGRKAESVVVSEIGEVFEPPDGLNGDLSAPENLRSLKAVFPFPTN